MDTTEIAKRLRQRMAEVQITQRDLARKAGVSTTRVNELANAKISDRTALKSVEKIADALDIPLAFLLSGDPAYLDPEEPPGVHAKLDEILLELKQERERERAQELKLLSEQVELPDPIKIGLWGSVAAGHGTVNQPRTEPLEWIYVPERLKPTDGMLMALEVHGDSMEPEVCPGDIVVVWYPTNQPAMRLLDNGQLVVVTVEGPGEEYEDYLKRYWLDPDTGKDELISTNPAYEPLEIPLQPLYVGQVKMVIKM